MLDTTSVMSFGIGMYGRAEFSELSVNGGEAFDRRHHRGRHQRARLHGLE
jgi:hypothetical protein